MRRAKGKHGRTWVQAFTHPSSVSKSRTLTAQNLGVIMWILQFVTWLLKTPSPDVWVLVKSFPLGLGLDLGLPSNEKIWRIEVVSLLR